MKHAYLILAHSNWELLQILLNCLDDSRNDIYVHIDAKVDKLPELNTNQAALFVLKNRVDVRWGDLSVVQAEYALFEAAECRANEYACLHLLSGVDLPLKSQDYIHRFVEEHPNEEFIGYTELKMSPALVRKVCRWHLFPKQFKSSSIFIKGARAAILRLQETLGIYRNKEIEFKKGSQWVSITPELMRVVLDRKEWVMKVFSHTFCADEIFVQTICWNSPLRSRIHNVDNDAAGCLRAIGWKDGCLYDWGSEDYQTLVSSDALFARKFNLKDLDFIRKITQL